MPLYTYEHPVTSETIDVIQSMKEQHVYVDEKEVQWKRVFHSPRANIDSQIDPFDNKAFVNNTKDKKGTYGDVMDCSKEMSQKRKKINLVMTLFKKILSRIQ